MSNKVEITYLDETGSTNDYALDLVANSDFQTDVAILAKKQTSGRGRLNGRLWESPIGNFYCSYIINLSRLKISLSETNLLTFAIMKSLQKYLINLTSSEKICVKIPNDILVADKKLAGILTEISYPYAVIGIGINLINSPIERATNLKDEFNLLVKPEELVENLYKFLVDGITECYYL